MRATKIIFINRYFYPDHSATSQLVSDLAFVLADRGHRVCVITSQQRYDAPDAKLAARESVKGVEIHRVWTSRFGRGFLPGRAVDYATFYLSTAWRLFRLARTGDLVVAKTDPPLISVVAGWVSAMRGARLVNWLQDLYPEVASALGIGLAQGAPGRFIAWLRYRSLRRAVGNVAIGRLMRDRLIGLGVDKDRVEVIHNWVDDVRIGGTKGAFADRAGNRVSSGFLHPGPPGEPQPDRPGLAFAWLRNDVKSQQSRLTPEGAGVDDGSVSGDLPDFSLRRDWGLEGRFVVGYSGNLGRAHEYQTLLDAATRLQDQEDVVFLFIGGGTTMDELRGEADARGIRNLFFRPYQPTRRLGDSLAVPDVHLAGLRPELEGLIVPSKFYGIAAAGRPTLFVGSNDGEIAGLLSEGEAGFTVPQGDGAALAEAILKLRDDSALRERLGSNARRLCDERFSRRAALERWERVLVAVAPETGDLVQRCQSAKVT